MRILVATDGSKAAHEAMDFVAGLAWPAETTLRVIEIIDTETANGGVWLAATMGAVEDAGPDLLRHASAGVSAAERHLAGRAFAVEGAVLHGRPATEIGREARRFGADLVVLGSRGHGNIEAMVLGSVSAEVVQHATVPVLVVRNAKSLDRMLIAWDGSPAARAAADLVKRWPPLAAASIEVLSVADIGVAWWAGFPVPGAPDTSALLLAGAEELRRSREKMARELADELRSPDHAATGMTADGEPAAEIIAAASARKADLVLMGTHARHGLSSLLLGSVARNVVLHAPCSVLVVPAPAIARAPEASDKEPEARTTQRT